MVDAFAAQPPAPWGAMARDYIPDAWLASRPGCRGCLVPGAG